MRTYKLIGLTGPSGAGKSAAADIFREYGFNVIDADVLAREIMKNDSPCLKTLSAVFGSQILNCDGSLNRQRLAEKAFETKENAELLNSLTHPFIYMLLVRKLKEYEALGCKSIVFDAPVLFESCGDVLCDVTVSVLCDRQERIRRIIKRDCITQEQALQRISVQKDDGYYISKSDFVIENNGNFLQMKEKVRHISDLIGQ